jgi:hypothetical protein
VIDGLHLTRAPEVRVLRAEHAGSVVIVLGHFVDTERWLPASAAVSTAAAALARSEAEFLDVTDAWSGRYLVLYADPTGTRVMTDATGMRSAFYCLDGRFLLSSHAPLVADLVQAEPSHVTDAFRATRRAFERGLLPMPGRSTPWDGVVALTPNMALGVPGRDLRRIFPRGSIPTLDAATAASMIGPRVRGQVETLVASGRPVCLSVTAGRDSRVSVAASRPSRDAITYFTYVRAGLETKSWDLSVARRMARRYGLSHRILVFGSTELEPGLDSVLQEATFLRHGPQLVAAYRSSFPSDAIHIRSNLGEIGRAFLRGKSWAAQEADRSPRLLTPESLARVWSYGTPPPPPIIEAFDEWMQAIGFREVEGMDPLDVLFWEHRMAAWHANVVLESDFAFDTHVLFNARSIYRDLLAVPLDDRTRGRVFELLVADMWPELARWPHARPKRTITASPTPQGASTVALGRRLGRCVGRRYSERVRRGR